MNTESKVIEKIKTDLEKAFEDGIKGVNKGLDTGIPKLNRAIHGVQRGVIIVIAGSAKAGKSSLCDSAFVINPYMQMIKDDNIDIEWFYWSLEMSKVDIRFKVIAHFFYRDYKISTITLPEGKTYRGSRTFTISSSYLLGRLESDDNEPIVVSEEHQVIFKEIVEKRINKMFGVYDYKGKKVKEGKITVIENDKDTNPTGIFHYLMNYAKENGKFIYEEYYTINNITGDREKRQRIAGYTPNNPNKYTIIIIDHMRALRSEKGYTMKQKMDKLSEYEIILRNLCGFTFVNIVHLNRSLTDSGSLRHNNEYLYPDAQHIKDSGNAAEDCDALLTMFDATEPIYNIKKHLGMDITDIYNYRSVHLVKSRNSETPAHIQLKAYFGISTFEEL